MSEIKYPVIFGFKTPTPPFTRKKRFHWTFNLIERTTVETQDHVDHIETQHKPIPIKFNFEEKTLSEKNCFESDRVSFSYTEDCPPGKEPDDTITVLYRFLAECYDLEQKSEQKGELKGNWGANFDLYDVLGNHIEHWTLNRVYPLSINFGELDYNSSSEVTIEIKIRFDEARCEFVSEVKLPPLPPWNRDELPPTL